MPAAAIGQDALPLTYERAFGGVGVLDNPFGTGAEAGSAAPNVTDPAHPQRAAGFAPIGRAYPLRRRLLGATPRAQLEGDVAEIPDDFDWAYYQAAPPDQRTDPLSGGEWIVLEGLHPTLPLLRTRLPGARGLARVHGLARFGVAEGQVLELAADTLRIDGDARRCTVVWRRSFPVYAEEALAALRIVAGVEVGGAALRWPAPAAAGPSRPPPRASAPPPPDAGVGTVMLAEEAAPAAALPFQGQVSPLAQAGGRREAPCEAPPGATVALAPEQEDRAAVKGALPFGQTVARASAPAVVMPFRGGASPLAQASPRGEAPRAPVFSGTFLQSPEEEDRAAAQRALPFGQRPVRAVPAPVVVEEAPVVVGRRKRSPAQRLRWWSRPGQR